MKAPSSESGLEREIRDNIEIQRLRSALDTLTPVKVLDNGQVLCRVFTGTKKRITLLPGEHLLELKCLGSRLRVNVIVDPKRPRMRLICIRTLFRLKVWAAPFEE